AAEKGKTSFIQKAVTLTSDSTLTFNWCVAAGKKRVILFVNGEQKAEINGEEKPNQWEEIPITGIPGAQAGTPYIIKWVYENNDDTGDVSQTAWIDDVLIKGSEVVDTTFENGAVDLGDFTTGGTMYTEISESTFHGGAKSIALTGQHAIGQGDVYIERTMDIPNDTQISFWQKVSSWPGYDFLKFYIDDVEQTAGNISGVVDWEQKTYNVAAGTRKFKWKFVKTSGGTTHTETGEDTAWIDDISITIMRNFADYSFTPTGTAEIQIPLNSDVLPYATGGDAEWVAQNTDTGFVLQSEEVSAGQSAYVERTVDLAAAGKVNFKWKVDNPGSATDMLSVYVDGVYSTSISGASGWVDGSVELDSGHHTVKWVYDRTQTFLGAPNGNAWVDDVSLEKDAIASFDYLPGLSFSLPTDFKSTSASPWLSVYGQSYDGDNFSAKAGRPGAGNVSTMTRTVELTEDLPVSFRWKISAASGNKVKFYIDNVLQSSLDGTSEGWEHFYKDLVSGTYAFKWEYEENVEDASGAAWIDDFEIAHIQSLDNFAYPSGTVFTVAEAASAYSTDSWVVENAVTVNGEDDFALQSGLVAAGSSSYIERKVTVAADSVALFRWRTDGSSTDKLTFKLDGTVKDYMSGSSNGWEWRAVKITSGMEHTLRWEFDRSLTATGVESGKAWIDELTVTTEDMMSFSKDFDTTIPLTAAEYSTTNWQSQNAIAYDVGGFAAQSGAVALGSSSYISKTITLSEAATVTFKWKLDSDSNDTLKFLVGPTTYYTITGNSNGWATGTVDLAAGTHTLKWMYTRPVVAGAAADNDRAWVDELNIEYANKTETFSYGTYPANTTLSLPSEEYTTDGWTTQNGVVYGESGFAAQTGAIGTGSSTFMQREITLGAAGNVEFYWKTSSEQGNELKFYIDNMDSPIASISGQDEDWQLFSGPRLEAGTHILKWVYAKDHDNVTSLDRGWVDDIRVNEESGKAITFDGTDDYIDVTADVSESAYGVSLWFKTTDLSAGIFSVGSGVLGATTNDRHLYLANGNLTANINYSIYHYDEDIATSGTNFADGKWHHVVHTFGAGLGHRIYVDGILRATGSQASSSNVEQTGLNIGYSNDASHKYFAGSLDDLSVWNRALSISDVAGLYSGSTVLTGNETGLNSYYNFDDESAKDQAAAHLHDGSMKNGPSFETTSKEISEESFSPVASYSTSVSVTTAGFATSNWVNQNTAARDLGGFAAQAGATAANSTSWFEKQNVVLTGPAKLTFNWRKTSAAGTDRLRLMVNGAYKDVEVPPLTAGSDNWVAVTYDFTGAGTYTVRWVYDRTGSTGSVDDRAWVDDVQIAHNGFSQNFSYPAGTELPLASGYSTSTGMEWKNQNDTGEARDAGGFAVQTGSTAINNTSWFERQNVVLTGPAKLTFNWRKTNSATSDKLRLLISKDGGAYTDTGVILTAGSSDWIAVAYDFTTSGTYKIRWAYDRVGSSGLADRNAWVDDVRVAPLEVSQSLSYPAGTELPLASGYSTSTGMEWKNQNDTG
ncbi:MAG: LamG domain-containing protein, partial [Candidatus Omnitrophota bacterium]